MRPFNPTSAETLDPPHTARRAMIDSQLRPSGINDLSTLERLAAVPREDYVPPEMRAFAYTDRAVSLGDGRNIAPPLFYGALLQEAKPRQADRVLVLDGGSGYLAALVQPLAGTVEVLNIDEAAKKSGKSGDYTLLLIDGAVEEFPTHLAKRLADDARVVTGVVTNGVTRLASGRKVGKSVALVELAEMGIPRLTAFDTVKAWAF
ncbi:Protein-L-isoaspartate(D-aspartate) O-methyltransferase [Alteripontixanthobacter maritimus]|uniref:Protein-L-isoaspartate(D-aspartate) O-methyltransferase n=1 Tax=Alteripontixanthobacter maritimus TaxID=2161824 RepID=A0A369Q8F6_9SPHN|nr:protein-L-isoaspartate O-methyltransferase [Alteripontixanthobacter maritimus]RDC61171.1 Protein-L-isoaspartate(D-aspartate) O-methyltransferase [Alteripontixanthobacter maritimus]